MIEGDSGPVVDAYAQRDSAPAACRQQLVELAAPLVPVAGIDPYLRRPVRPPRGRRRAENGCRPRAARRASPVVEQRADTAQIGGFATPLSRQPDDFASGRRRCVATWAAEALRVVRIRVGHRLAPHLGCRPRRRPPRSRTSSVGRREKRVSESQNLSINVRICCKVTKRWRKIRYICVKLQKRGGLHSRQ